MSEEGAVMTSAGNARETRPWAVVVKLDIKPEHASEWLDSVDEVLDTMRHEKSFVSTTLCAHPSEPGKFLLFEIWRDREEFFTVQANRDYRRPFMEKMQKFLQKPVNFDEWRETRTDYAVQMWR